MWAQLVGGLARWMVGWLLSWLIITTTMMAYDKQHCLLSNYVCWPLKHNFLFPSSQELSNTKRIGKEEIEEERL